MTLKTGRLKIGVACAVVCAAALSACATSLQADDRVRQIIENVRSNESLYEKIEVRMTERYELIGRKPDVSDVGGNPAYQTAKHDKDVRYVSQDGMFRVDIEGQRTTAGPTFSADRIRMFDGRTTRLLAQKRIGNIIAGRQEDNNFVRPHMLLLRSSLELVCLSTYLQGHAAMLAANVGWEQGHTLETTYHGEAEFQGA